MILRDEGRDRGGAHLVSRVTDLLAVQDGEAVDLLDDVADVDGGRRRAPGFDLGAKLTKVVGRDFAKEPVFPDGQDIPVEDRLASTVCCRPCGLPSARACPPRRTSGRALGPVGIHREFTTAAAR